MLGMSMYLSVKPDVLQVRHSSFWSEGLQDPVQLLHNFFPTYHLWQKMKALELRDYGYSVLEERIVFNGTVNCYDYIVLMIAEWNVSVEQWYNNTARKSQHTHRKTCPISTLCTINPTCTGLGSNTTPCSERLPVVWCSLGHFYSKPTLKCWSPDQSSAFTLRICRIYLCML